jgi:hypothetical protein
MSAGDDDAFKARLLQLAEEEATKSAQTAPPAAPVDGEAPAPIEDLLQDLLSALKKEQPVAAPEEPQA